MTENPYANVMERAWKEASDKGHELWQLEGTR
jgi:hypothetical protein